MLGTIYCIFTLFSMNLKDYSKTASLHIVAISQYFKYIDVLFF